MAILVVDPLLAYLASGLALGDQHLVTLQQSSPQAILEIRALIYRHLQQKIHPNFLLYAPNSESRARTGDRDGKTETVRGCGKAEGDG